MFRKKKWLKETIPKTFFPGLVKISFDIPADFLFQKSANFCSLFEKMLQCKTISAQNDFLKQLLRHRKVQVCNQFKKFCQVTNFLPLKHRKQTQAYYISKNKSTKRTCGHVECRLATLPRFFCEKSGDIFPKMREQFWDYRVLNGLKLFRSKSENIFENEILP